MSKGTPLRFASIARAAILAVVAALASPAAMASEPGRPGPFPLAESGRAAPICFSESEAEVVGMAAKSLAGDIEAVTGVRPEVAKGFKDVGDYIVIAGTVGGGGIIGRLAEAGKLDVDDVRGRWETYTIAVVDDPLPGVKQALAVAGSDRRGTAYGLFEISRMIGVSPWIWWADSRPDKREELFIDPGAKVYGPPSVKYRGIFINDEDFGIHPWAAKTLDPETGDIGPGTYARVFELLLRLRANHLWPAMHDTTKAFNYFPENKALADRYAIVMGSSHCEPMLRNNVDEWRRDGEGRYWYQFNGDNILSYWEDRVRENGGYENVYTLGMRGLHDSPIHVVGPPGSNIRLLRQVIADQRELLARWVNPEVSLVPQVFCPYNEVLGYLEKGLEIPEDVTMLWVDDNHGYNRRLPTREERLRPGGAGVYYHVSYWGPPHDYLWLCTTPPGLVWEEMAKAYVHGAREVWMLNVGDIKPAEILTEFFLDIAWDAERYGPGAQGEFLREFAGREFGPERAEDIAGVLSDYYLLNFRRKPEHMGFNLIGEKYMPVFDPRLDLYGHGDEAGRRIAAFADLVDRAEEIYEGLPGEKRDAFYQFVLYPARCSAAMNGKMLHAYKSREYAKRGRADAATHAELAERAFETIALETDYYNDSLAGGKWKHMMSYHPRDLQVFGEPDTGKARLREKPSLGVMVEGRDSPVRPGGSARLPAFNRFTGRRMFVDLYNRGGGVLDWSAKAPDWVVLDRASGTIGDTERLWVGVDFGRAPGGREARGEIVFSARGESVAIEVIAFNPPSGDVAPGDYVEDNGLVAIDASGYQDSVPGAGGSKWTEVEGLGRSGSALAVLPFDAGPMGPGEGPRVEYKFHVFNPGRARLIVETLPTNPINGDHSLVLAVSIDGGEPIELKAERKSIQIAGFFWSESVLAAVVRTETELELGEGAHTLRVVGMDPSVVLDRIVVDLGGLGRARMPLPPTRAQIKAPAGG